VRCREIGGPLLVWRTNTIVQSVILCRAHQLARSQKRTDYMIQDAVDFTKTVFSPDRVYRYTLWRQWWSDELFITRTKLNYAMFIGLNPSTADETENDPTIRKCIGFAEKWGYDALCMTNLFAYRATDPRKMKGHDKPIGVDNDRWLVACAREAGIIIAAWGVNGAHMGRDEEVLNLLDDVWCLRTTKNGYPEHPLYVPYATEPVRFSARYRESTGP